MKNKSLFSNKNHLLITLIMILSVSVVTENTARARVEDPGSINISRGDRDKLFDNGLSDLRSKALAFSCSSVTEIPEAECDALVALYTSANGASWIDNAGWLVTDTPCSWYGVGCDSGHVWSVSLNSNNLTGTIPADLEDLQELIDLTLNDNELTGTIPTQLGNLSDLETLNMYGNDLSGGIPASLGTLYKLVYLRLFENDLDGNIPPELGNLSNLVFLALNDNELTGTIPSQLGSLVNLERLRVDGNNLTGVVPPEIGNLPSLLYLHISFNSLT